MKIKKEFRILAYDIVSALMSAKSIKVHEVDLESMKNVIVLGDTALHLSDSIVTAITAQIEKQGISPGLIISEIQDMLTE